MADGCGQQILREAASILDAGSCDVPPWRYSLISSSALAAARVFVDLSTLVLAAACAADIVWALAFI